MSNEKTSTVDMSGGAAVATADITTGPLNIKGLQCFGIGLVWASLNASDATAKVQVSGDGTNYSDYPGSSITIASGSDSTYYDFPQGSSASFARIVYAHGSNSAGTMAITGYVDEVRDA
jgi:hypothetical protein